MPFCTKMFLLLRHSKYKTIQTTLRPFQLYRKQCIYSMPPEGSNLKLNHLQPNILKRTIFTKRTEQTVDKLKLADKVSPSYELIYKNTMNKYVFCFHIGSFISALFVVLVTVYCTYLEGDLTLDTENIFKVAVKETDADLYVALIALMMFSLILQLTVAQIPLRIYNLPSENKYIFIFYGKWPLSKTKVKCGLNEVIKVEEKGFMPWRDSKYEIKNERKIVLQDHYFRKPSDQNIMLGYEKPYDM